MSPSQFRAINKNGVQAEFDLTLGHPNKNVVVDYDEGLDGATINYPFESYMKVWTVYGRVEEIRWNLPEEKGTKRTPTIIYKLPLHTVPNAND
jgi:hypothetical protein